MDLPIASYVNEESIQIPLEQFNRLRQERKLIDMVIVVSEMTASIKHFTRQVSNMKLQYIALLYAFGSQISKRQS